MSVKYFLYRHLTQVRKGGIRVLWGKLKNFLKLVLILPSSFLALPIVIIIRLIRPLYLIRFGALLSSRIGHLAANTELYLCEKDAGINKPMQHHIDIFYIAYKPICNKQLAIMWKRVLCIWPACILAPIARVNRLIPGGGINEIGDNTQHDRDVHNLLERFPPHLQFTDEEEALGEASLRAMGITSGSKFVCLIVRDSAYLNRHQSNGNWNYHNYRDCNIQNYILASEALADRGYFVIRMGVFVNEAMKSKHKRVIDYAFNGMRNDFMDIYLGAKCAFCISSSLGWDSIPEIFRRPIVYTNLTPFGYIRSFGKDSLNLIKHLILTKEGRELTLNEIFTHGVGFSLHTSDYESKGIQLIENTPEEILDVAIEMADCLNGSWQIQKDDEQLQKSFWKNFPTDAVANGVRLHGEIRARFGTQFLRNNREWLG